MKSLSQRMIEAADTLEEVSALYGYHRPDSTTWTAKALRHEAEHVEADSVQPTGLYDGIGRGGPW